MLSALAVSQQGLTSSAGQSYVTVESEKPLPATVLQVVWMEPRQIVMVANFDVTNCHRYMSCAEIPYWADSELLMMESGLDSSEANLTCSRIWRLSL